MSRFTKEETDLLIQAGDFCLDRQLFVGLDAKRWPLYRGHALMMARVLAKYHDLLDKQFEGIELILARAPEAPVVRVLHARNSFGPTAIFEAPYIPKEKFHQYKDTLKRFGLWFDGESKNWFVPAKHMETTNFSVLYERICDLNFEISESYSDDWFGD